MTRVEIGRAVTVDGLPGVVAETTAKGLYLRMQTGARIAVTWEEIEANWEDRFVFPDDISIGPWDFSRSDWEERQEEQKLDFAERVARLDWIVTGMAPSWFHDLDVEYRSDKTARVQKVAKLEGVGERAMWLRLGFYEDIARLDIGRALGIPPRKNHNPHPSVTEEWIKLIKNFALACLKAGLSEITKQLFLERADELAERDGIPHPERTLANEIAGEILAPLGVFKWALRVQDGNATRADGNYGHVDALYAGQYVLLDSTRLDVHARSSFGEQIWVEVEVTAAIDLYSRCIVAIRVSPVSTNGVDIATLLFDIYRPSRTPGESSNLVNLPGVGAPEVLLVNIAGDGDEEVLVSSIRPTTFVVDNGKVFDSAQFHRVAHVFGTSIQFGRKLKGSDKAHKERFFGTLRTLLIQRLAAYKGHRPTAHGKNAEKDTVYPISVIDRMVREIVAGVYHCADHTGLHPFGEDGETWAPLQKLEESIARNGILLSPTNRDLAVELLPIEWVTIQHDGIHLGKRLYRGPGINAWRDRKSNHAAHDGKWPIFVNMARPERAFFKDPITAEIHAIPQVGGIDFDMPHSIETAIRSVNHPESEVKRLPRGKRDRVVGRAAQGIVDRADDSLGIPRWEARMLERQKGHKDIFHITPPNADDTVDGPPAPASPIDFDIASPADPTRDTDEEFF